MVKGPFPFIPMRKPIHRAQPHAATVEQRRRPEPVLITTTAAAAQTGTKYQSWQRGQMGVSGHRAPTGGRRVPHLLSSSLQGHSEGNRGSTTHLRFPS